MAKFLLTAEDKQRLDLLTAFEATFKASTEQDMSEEAFAALLNTAAKKDEDRSFVDQLTAQNKQLTADLAAKDATIAALEGLVANLKSGAGSTPASVAPAAEPMGADADIALNTEMSAKSDSELLSMVRGKFNY
jgi:hypothetical protein